MAFLRAKEEEEQTNLEAIAGGLLDKQELAAQERLAAKYEPVPLEKQIAEDHLIAQRLFDDLNCNSENTIKSDMSPAEAERIRERASNQRPTSRKKRKRLNDSFGSDRTDLSADLFRSDNSDSDDDETDASSSPELFASGSPAETDTAASLASLGLCPSSPDETETASDNEARASLHLSSLSSSDETSPAYKGRSSLGFCCSTQLCETNIVPFPDFGTASLSPKLPDENNAPSPPDSYEALAILDYDSN